LSVNNNADLGKSLIADNWKIMLDEVEEPIVKKFGEIYKDALNSVFEKTPYEELFAL
jgi:Haemolymph juvenile hormone binding protein (JHBP)